MIKMPNKAQIEKEVMLVLNKKKKDPEVNKIVRYMMRLLSNADKPLKSAYEVCKQTKHATDEGLKVPDEVDVRLFRKLNEQSKSFIRFYETRHNKATAN